MRQLDQTDVSRELFFFLLFHGSTPNLFLLFFEVRNFLCEVIEDGDLSGRSEILALFKHPLEEKMAL